MIKILLVDDQKTVRESFRALLNSIADFQVVGAVDSGLAAIARVGELHPDLVLVDIEMPGLDGIATTRIICQQFTGVRVIILSMHDQDNYVTQALKAGAMAYLFKNIPAKQLEETIRSVYRGYAQVEPGLLNQIIAVSAAPIVVNSEENRAVERVSVSAKIQQSSREVLRSTPADSQGKKKPSFYLTMWLVGNIFLWSTSLLYLKFTSPTYSSIWTIALPGTASSTSINLPEIGQASSQNQSPFSNSVSDPRENYRLLANSEDVVKPAADSLQMTLKEFGEPVVKILDNTTLMEFRMKGSTPQESQAKAIAVHQALKNNLDRLKNIESTEPDQNILNRIEVAQSRLEKARQELADYQESSGLNSNIQLENLANSIEQMRVDLAQLRTQQQRAQGKSNQLLQKIKLSPEEAQDALSLHSDRLFTQYLDNYSQTKTELVNLEARYLSSHPLVIAQQTDSQAAEAALLQRASSLLGRSVDISTLSRLGLNGNRNQNNSQKENLLGELINLQGEEQGLESQTQELKQQIIQLETQQKQRSRSGSKLDRLRKNVQIAEAVYSSTLTQLEINQTNTSNLYPPISLLTQPNLPTEPSSPKTKLVLLGPLIGSLFLTTALLSWWWRDRHFSDALSWENNSSQNNRRTLSSSENNIIQTIIKK